MGREIETETEQAIRADTLKREQRPNEEDADFKKLSVEIPEISRIESIIIEHKGMQ